MRLPLLERRGIRPYNFSNAASAQEPRGLILTPGLTRCFVKSSGKVSRKHLQPIALHPQFAALKIMYIIDNNVQYMKCLSLERLACCVWFNRRNQPDKSNEYA